MEWLKIVVVVIAIVVFTGYGLVLIGNNDKKKWPK